MSKSAAAARLAFGEATGDMNGTTIKVIAERSGTVKGFFPAIQPPDGGR